MFSQQLLYYCLSLEGVGDGGDNMEATSKLHTAKPKAATPILDLVSLGQARKGITEYHLVL